MKSAFDLCFCIKISIPPPTPLWVQTPWYIYIYITEDQLSLKNIHITYNIYKTLILKIHITHIYIVHSYTLYGLYSIDHVRVRDLRLQRRKAKRFVSSSVIYLFKTFVSCILYALRSHTSVCCEWRTHLYLQWFLLDFTLQCISGLGTLFMIFRSLFTIRLFFFPSHMVKLCSRLNEQKQHKKMCKQNQLFVF